MEIKFINDEICKDFDVNRIAYLKKGVFMTEAIPLISSSFYAIPINATTFIFMSHVEALNTFDYIDLKDLVEYAKP